MPAYEWSHEHKAWVKQCSRCKRVFIGDRDEASSVRILGKDFAGGNNSDGFHSQCRDCAIYSNLIYKGAEHHDKMTMFDKQKGRCGICGCELALRKGNEGAMGHIDHDQKTGKVRGMLCKLCNVGLGCFRDETKLLTRAISYLVRNGYR